MRSCPACHQLRWQNSSGGVGSVCLLCAGSHRGPRALGHPKGCTHQSLLTGTSQSKATVSKSSVLTRTWTASTPFLLVCTRWFWAGAKPPASRLCCASDQFRRSLDSLFVCPFWSSLPSTSKKSVRPQSACLALCLRRTLPSTKRFYPGKSRNPTARPHLGAAASRSQHPGGLSAVSSAPPRCGLSPPERSSGLRGSWWGSRSSFSAFAICFGQALVPFPGRWQHPSLGPPQGGHTVGGGQPLLFW